MKDEEVPTGYKLVSFDVTSLFTNVPLDHTINLILRKIYREKLIKTKIQRKEMKMLLELCTKELHFCFNNKMYKQVDGVVMGNPLGPVIANIFMVELENIKVPTMSNMLTKWHRYVDDTIAFVKEDQIENVLTILNSYHKDIKFTHEVEENAELPFLDVMLHREQNNKLRLKVYRKKTCSNIYLHWKSFAPTSWKIGTLDGMIRRAHIVCTNQADLETELSFVENVFKTINGYPQRIIQQSKDKVKAKLAQQNTVELPNDDIPSNEEEIDEKRKPFMIMPYAGERGEKVMKKVMRKIPEDVRPRIVYTGTKLSSFFPVKDEIKDKYISNIVYYFDSASENNVDYTGETKCRWGKRIVEHQGRDKKSAIVINFQSKNLPPPQTGEFRILAKNYPNRLKRRIAESLYIKENKSSLNVQVDCYKLKLFN